MSEEITILDEPVVSGITEVDRAPTPATRRNAQQVPEIRLEPATPPARLLFNENEVYAEPGYLYYKAGGVHHGLARTTHHYPEGGMWRWRPAGARLYRGKPVFFSDSQHEVIFCELEKKIEIEISQEMKAIAFFVVPFHASNHIGLDDEIATIVWDGRSVKYMEAYNGPLYLGLETPTLQSSEVIFEEIMNFISRSVKGVSRELKRAGQELKEVLDRKSEDIFYYFQDIKPVDGKEQLHQELLSKFEKIYEEDQVLRTSKERECAQHVQLIKGARSQMPSGHKGKPIRLAYMKSPVIGDLLDWFDVRKHEGGIAFTFAFRKDLVLEGRCEEDDEGDSFMHELNYGRPLIEVYMVADKGRGRDTTYIKNVTGESLDFKAFIHPHLDGVRNWCLGTYITPLNNALVGGNIPLAASLIWQYLNNYNEESPLIHIDGCAETMDSVRKRSLIVRRA